MKVKQFILTTILVVSVILSFGQEVIKFEENGKYGFKDSTGTVILESKYSHATILSKNLIAVHLNTKWGLFNNEGKEVVPLKFDMIFNFEDNGLALTFIGKSYNNGNPKQGKYGFINKQGKEVIACKYDDIDYNDTLNNFFSKGLVRLKLNEKWGFVNEEGIEVASFKFDIIFNFEDNGLALTFIGKLYNNGNPKQGKYGLINTEGKEIVPCKYDRISTFSNNGLANVFIGETSNNGNPKQGKYGLINTEGKEIVPCKYDYFHKNNNITGRYWRRCNRRHYY